MSFIAQQSYKIDLTPHGGYVVVYASQHDNEARGIVFKIYNQGKVFDIPANINVSVQGVKSNGGYFTHNCTYSGNLVTMPIDDDMTDVVGKAICVLKFTNVSQQKLATAKFILNVDSDSSSEGIIIDTEVEEIFNQMLNEIRAQAASVNAEIAELQSMVGSPLVASTVSAMTDHNKIYVYTGSESGYTNGNWYYWNGSAWTSGGVYNSVAVNMDSVPTQGSNNTVSSGGVYSALHNTDTTLTQSGQPADGKAVGDEIDKLKNEIEPLGLVTNEYIYTASSGYQSVPITIAPGVYLATNTSNTSATFRTAENVQISNLYVPPTSETPFELIITEENAANIAYIRMYLGSVTITPKKNIITRIDTLEDEIVTKANKPLLFNSLSIQIENGYIKTNGTTYVSGQHFEVTVDSDVDVYKISGSHLNAEYPFLCEHAENGDALFTYSGDSGVVSNYVFTPHPNTAYFDVNANNNGACATGVYSSIEDYVLAYMEKNKKIAYIDYDLRQSREAQYNLEQKNPFVWKAFDKAYFSFMNDDGRPDLYLYKNLCDIYAIPYGNAVPWEAIKQNTTVVDGMSLVDYCKKIIAEGGEIFTHANNPLTSASTEADIMGYFRDGKKIIEDALDTKIYGIVQAGGSGYSTFDYNEGQKFCLAYYEFSDAYGITPQYKLARTRLVRSSYESDEAQINAFKAVVDDAIANHKWIRFFCHGTDEVSISVLTSVFDYISAKVANGDCAWTKWKTMYDTFRSSALENRIAALE